MESEKRTSIRSAIFHVDLGAREFTVETENREESTQRKLDMKESGMISANDWGGCI
jgi:hypothetical protein